MGGKQAGCIGLLTMYASGCNVLGVVAYDELVKMLAEQLNIPIFTTINEKGFINALRESDLLVSVHGREIVPKELLEIPRLGCINAHPCLYNYKGANPVERLLKDGNTKASVAVHYMVEKVDAGEVIVEEFVDVEGKKTVGEVYNELYPYYAAALPKALDIIKTKNG